MNNVEIFIHNVKWKKPFSVKNNFLDTIKRIAPAPVHTTSSLASR